MKAKGIPDRRDYGDLSSLSENEALDYFLQHHIANRAGPHYDMRFGDRRRGLFSWAVPKGMPTPGNKHLAVQQPIHDYGYGHWAGSIPTGYGAGRVDKVDQGQLLITRILPNTIHFTITHKRYPERFVLVKPKTESSKNWLLVNTTPREQLDLQKVKYKQIPRDQVESVLSNLADGDSVQAKVDGASALIKLMKEGVEAVSYRTSKVTGGPIVHTEKLFGGRPRPNYPKSLRGSVLRGEMYATEGDEVLPVQSLNSLLNSSTRRSLEKQKAANQKLRVMLFDIERLGNKDLDKSTTPYEERRRILEHLYENHFADNDVFELAKEVYDPGEALAMWQEIEAKKHPLTEEGVVVHPKVGLPLKAKTTDEYDVYIRNVLPGKGRAQNAGALEYSMEPDGPIVGRVGSGLTDDMRSSIAQAPNDFIGRVARLKSQQKNKTGALREPVFLGLHEDYPTKSRTL